MLISYPTMPRIGCYLTPLITLRQSNMASWNHPSFINMVSDETSMSRMFQRARFDSLGPYVGYPHLERRAACSQLSCSAVLRTSISSTGDVPEEMVPWCSMGYLEDHPTDQWSAGPWLSMESMVNHFPFRGLFHLWSSKRHMFFHVFP
jgi:hypothetical protein